LSAFARRASCFSPSRAQRSAEAQHRRSADAAQAHKGGCTHCQLNCQPRVQSQHTAETSSRCQTPRPRPTRHGHAQHLHRHFTNSLNSLKSEILNPFSTDARWRRAHPARVRVRATRQPEMHVPRSTSAGCRFTLTIAFPVHSRLQRPVQPPTHDDDDPHTKHGTFIASTACKPSRSRGLLSPHAQPTAPE